MIRMIALVMWGWFAFVVEPSQHLPKNQPKTDPYSAVLESIGLNSGLEGEGAIEDSLRLRVCRFQRRLSDLRPMAQIAFQWAEKDFPRRSEKERLAMIEQLSQQNLESIDLDIRQRYRNIITRQSWFLKMGCRELRAEYFPEWNSANSARGDSDENKFSNHSRREGILDAWLYHDAFIESRVKIFLKEGFSVRSDLKNMYKNALNLGDPIAAMAIVLSSQGSFETAQALEEPFGPPVGPYACSTSLPKKEEGVVSTTFYDWYEFGNKAAPDFRATLSKWEPHFSLMPSDVSGMSYKDINWLRSQFELMAFAGIDMLFIPYRGGPYGHLSYSDQALTNSARVAWQNPKLPKIALMMDGFLYSPRGNKSGGRFSLTSKADAKLLTATALDFFSLVPATRRASYHQGLVVAFRDVSQIKRVSGFALLEFIHAFTRVMGVRPSIIYPRQEMVDYVIRSNPRSVQDAVDRMVQGVQPMDALNQLMTANALLMGKSQVDVVMHWLSRVIFDPKRTTLGTFWTDKTNANYSMGSLITLLTERSIPVILSLQQKRWIGVAQDQQAPMEVAPKDLSLQVSSLLRDDRFPGGATKSREALNNYLSLAVLGRCPKKGEADKLNSMLETWDRGKAGSYLMASHDGLQQLASGWLVDLVLVPLKLIDLDVKWEGETCGVPFGVAVVYPGRNVRGAVTSTGTGRILIDRKMGSHYTKLWEDVLGRKVLPDFVHVESWNGFHDGTAIGNTLEYGDRYIDMTRKFTQAYHQRWNAAYSPIAKRRSFRVPASVQKKKQL